MSSLLLACFDNNEDAVFPCTGTLDDKAPSLLPIRVDGSGQPLLSQELTSSPTVQVLIDNHREEAISEGQNMGSQAVDGDGILHPLLSPRLTPSSPSLPFRRSDSPPFFMPSLFDDGVLPTTHFSIRLPSPSSHTNTTGPASRQECTYLHISTHRRTSSRFLVTLSALNVSAS